MIYEIVPVIISIFLLYSLRIRKSYWESKVLYQIEKYRIKDDEKKHIVDIVEDVNESINFLGSVIAILIGIVLILIKRWADPTSINTSFEYYILFSLLILYLLSLFKLYRMKKELQSDNPKVWKLRKYTYSQVYEFLLKIGYVCLISMIIYHACLKGSLY
jgi:hypothetical protein